MQGAGAGSESSYDYEDYPAVVVGSIWEADDEDVEASHRTSREQLRAHRARQRATRQSKQAGQALVGRPSRRTRPSHRVRPPLTEEPHAPHKAALPRRELRNLYVCEVGRFLYRTFHRMEGRWNGEAVVYDGSKQDHRIVSVELKFSEEDSVWEERQTLTDSSGLSTTQFLRYEPAGEGVLLVHSSPEEGEGVDTRLEEHSENVMILTAISHTTKKPLLVETITMSDDFRRVRTVQRFDSSGAFQVLYHIKESRVIDAVSGAVEEYHTTSGTRRI